MFKTEANPHPANQEKNLGEIIFIEIIMLYGVSF